MDIRQLVAESALRGFTPNPWLWNAMVQRSGIQAIPSSPYIRQPGVYDPVVGGPTTFDTIRQAGAGALPLARQVFSGASLGNDTLDSLMGQASSLLGGAGSIYGLGSSIASGNVPGIVGGALSTGALGARLAGSTGLLGGSTGSLIGGLSPYLGGLGTLASLGTGIAQGNTPQAIIGAVPGLLSSAGSIASGLGAAQAATIPVAAEGGFGGAAGAELAGLGSSLSGLGGVAGLYAAAILMAMQDQARQDVESRRDETLSIQRNFPGAWASLSAAPKALETVAEYDRLPGGGGINLDDAIKQAQDSIYRTGDVAQYIGTRGGASTESKPIDVSAFAQASPRLYSDALLAMLKGSQNVAQAGGTQPAGTNVFMGPFPNQFANPWSASGTYLEPGGPQPEFNPRQALWAMLSQSGLPTSFISRDQALQGSPNVMGSPYYAGLQDPTAALGTNKTVSGNIPNYYGSAGGTDSFAPEQTYIPRFNESTETQLAGVTPVNEYDALINILKQANPNFDASTLGTEVGNLGSTRFPGRSGSSQMGAGPGLAFAPFLPSAGQQSGDKQQLSTDPNAIAVPINVASGNTLNTVMEASKAFLGSA